MKLCTIHLKKIASDLVAAPAGIVRSITAVPMTKTINRRNPETLTMIPTVCDRDKTVYDQDKTTLDNDLLLAAQPTVELRAFTKNDSRSHPLTYWLTPSGLPFILRKDELIPAYVQIRQNPGIMKRNRKGGYIYCNHICMSLHSIVAILYAPGRDLFRKQVDHIDNNRYNNAASNLRWVSQSENIRAYYDFRRRALERAANLNK